MKDAKVPMPRPAQTPASAGVLRRACACGGTPGADGECASCKAKRLALQRRSHAAESPGLAPPVVHDVLRSSGRPLEPAVRADMENRLGHDFSRVRVHSDARAAESAQAVSALAYTVGSSVVFDAGRYAPGTSDGRQLLAHELAHVAQQGSAAPPGSALPIGAPGDAAEREADRAAAGTGTPRRDTGSASLRRKMVVDPAGSTSEVVDHLQAICPAPIMGISYKSGEITSASGCETTPGEGCDCVCDVVNDTKRTYTVKVAASALTAKSQKLFDGTTASVPEISHAPTTSGDADPVTNMPSAASAAEFGAFDSSGTGVWAPLWRVFGHEVCGHGRKKQTYSGDTGNRKGHDSTIDTENAIAKPLGEPPRGHFADKRQGESFFNETGKRSKVVFKLKNGLHFEAP